MDSGLTMGLDLNGGVVGLAFSGVFDAGSVAVVDVLIDRLAGSSFHQVVVDVSAMSAVDGVGVNVLTGLRYYLEGRGAAVEVRGACPVVAQALAVGPPEVVASPRLQRPPAALRPHGSVAPAF